MEQKDISSSTQKTDLAIGWRWFNPDRPTGSGFLFFFFKKRKLPITLISRSILSKGKNLSDGHYNFSLDFREFWGCGDGIFGWNEILQRVSWVGILKEKSERREINQKRIRRALEYPKPISPAGDSSHSPRTGTSLIWLKCRKSSAIFLRKTLFLPIRKYRRNFGIFTDFLGNFPIFPTSPGRAQDTKSVQFF